MQYSAHKLEPLAPVVGGVVDPDDLVGRDDEVAELLQHVATGGAYVDGDRRRGKTSVLRRVTRDLRDANHVVISVSAETDSIDSFNAAFLDAVRREGVFGKRWDTWTKAFAGEVTLGTSSAGLRLKGELSKPGAKAPEVDLIRLCTAAARDAGKRSVVIVIDEVAQLAWFLHEQDRDSAAEFLRTLRRLRQDSDSAVRVVLAGSVGLHHAVEDRTVINDLPVVDIARLRHEDATLLARRLMLSVCGEEDEESASRLAAAVDDLPYYVQRLVADLGTDLTLSGIDWNARVRTAIDDNDWETDHYVSRLAKYYPREHHLVKAMLDALAADDGASLTVDELVRELSVLSDPPDDIAVSRLLRLLKLDHYLYFEDGRYAFVSPLVHKIWVRARRRLR
jgi:hypothetical protein